MSSLKFKSAYKNNILVILTRFLSTLTILIDKEDLLFKKVRMS